MYMYWHYESFAAVDNFLMYLGRRKEHPKSFVYFSSWVKLPSILVDSMKEFELKNLYKLYGELDFYLNKNLYYFERWLYLSWLALQKNVKENYEAYMARMSKEHKEWEEHEEKVQEEKKQWSENFKAEVLAMQKRLEKIPQKIPQSIPPSILKNPSVKYMYDCIVAYYEFTEEFFSELWLKFLYELLDLLGYAVFCWVLFSRAFTELFTWLYSFFRS